MKKGSWVFARVRNALITGFFAVLAILVLFGFMFDSGWYMFTLSRPSLDGVTLHTEFEVYPADSTVIVVRWENSSEKLISLRRWYLEKYSSGVWTRVEWYSQQGVWNAMGYPVEPGESREYSYEIGNYSDSLIEGRYRILAPYESEGKTYNGKAEFTVSEKR